MYKKILIANRGEIAKVVRGGDAPVNGAEGRGRRPGDAVRERGGRGERNHRREVDSCAHTAARADLPHASSHSQL